MEEHYARVNRDWDSYQRLAKDAPLHSLELASQQDLTSCMDQFHLSTEKSGTSAIKGVNTQEWGTSSKSTAQSDLNDDELIVFADASAIAVEQSIRNNTIEQSRTDSKEQHGRNYSSGCDTHITTPQSEPSDATAEARQMRYKQPQYVATVNNPVMVRSMSESGIGQKKERRGQRYPMHHKPKPLSTDIQDRKASARKHSETKDAVVKTKRHTQTGKHGCEKGTGKRSLENYVEVSTSSGMEGKTKVRHFRPKKQPSTSTPPSCGAYEQSASMPAFHPPPNQGQYGVAVKPVGNEADEQGLVVHYNSDPMLALANLNQGIKKMKTISIDRHDREKNELSVSISKIRTKNISIHELDIGKIQAEKTSIQNSIRESTLRKEAFLAYCAEIEDEVEELQSINPSKAMPDYFKYIEVLCSRFDRECRRYDKALPMYAQRSNILKMVSEQQTCILIGETGSGKSTQVVQYLYEAGYANNGIIACTQPRKLAAISLAQHVSKEVCETIGNTYGYAATKVKQNRDTKVVFMTDHALLNECIADQNLSKFSCLVIDEAHERSIHTDILIALIKRCLPMRQDLKVIITSATINPTLFSSYFGGPYECPVIEVSGRTFPVDVFWDESNEILVETDYVSKSVSKAFEIHVANKGKQGDILVFLTGPSEIERACKLAHSTLKNEAIILPLHGKLQSEEQQKVFDVTEGKRKVVFSTNVAETSVTIPGIRYVIDTGLSKEMCYDPQKNMNSLEIRPISKSSANQRKGRAGRTSAGECHRLYSMDDYANMRDDSVPEILRITLAFAVMKLYEFGIDDVHSFEFVDAPDKKALDDAVANLKFLGAIRDGKLTKLGRKMALLPLEPNLSKVLLDAIDEGVGMEGIAAAAISTLAGRVFFRPSKDELKAESDQKRIPFCQQSGDQMTHLHTYFQWSLQGSKERNNWCVENYVNGKSMRMVEQLVSELRLILKQNCGVQISPEMSSLEKADHILPRLFFDAFLQNLCVHLGHDRIGYWCEKLPAEQLVLHYGSSLQYLGSNPQCIIYEKTQKTSQHFLLQVLPVHEKWIRDAVDSGKIPCHPAESPLYQFYRVSSLNFSHIGQTVLIRLREKYHPDRRNPVPEFAGFDVQPLFEYSREQGELRVFSQECFHDQIQQSVNCFVEDVKKKLKVESHVDGIVGSNDHVRIVMGEGGSVQHVLMPDEFRAIVVRGLNKDFRFLACDELKKIGECSINEHISQDRTVQLFAKFQNPSDALRALSHTFQSFEEPNVVIHRQLEKKRNMFCLKVVWPRRTRKNFAFIKFNDGEFEEICAFFLYTNFLQDPSTSLKFQRITQTCSVKICEIASYMDEDFIKSRFLSHWPSLTEVNVYFMYDPAPVPDQCMSQRQALDDALSSYVPRTSYYLDFRNPSAKSVFYKAFVHFDDSADCLIAQQQLLNHHIYSAEMSLSSSVRYSPHVFSVVQSSIKEIASAVAPALITDNKDKWGNVFIKICANNMDAFTKARDAINAAVEPFRMCFTGDSKYDKYTSTACFLKAVKEIQHKTSTYMKLYNSNICDNTLEIFGSLENREKAKRSVEAHLDGLLTDEINIFEIKLKDYKPGIMKHLVMQYGPNVEKLVDDFEGITATRLDYRKHILILFCTDVVHVSFLNSLDKFKGKVGMTQQALTNGMDSSVTIDCCVCSESHVSDKNFYRLECCGHVYCKDCIEMQLSSSAITFPVTCAADKCEEKFFWKDFDNLFKIKLAKLQDIKSSALKHFVSLNSKVYHHCITPNCDMIYLISENGTRFVCDQCGANICTNCHTNWHEGYLACPMYKAKDEELDKWIKENTKNRKKCPKCSIPIEKNGGCRKIFCISCKACICWLCLKYFDTVTECYDHLTASHGGIFDL